MPSVETVKRIVRGQVGIYLLLNPSLEGIHSAY